MSKSTATAKIFWTGRSQAVRLPKEFRFEGTEVKIHRVGQSVVLEPVTGRRWTDGFWELFGAFGDDFDLDDRGADQLRDLDFG